MFSDAAELASPSSLSGQAVELSAKPNIQYNRMHNVYNNNAYEMQNESNVHTTYAVCNVCNV